MVSEVGRKAGAKKSPVGKPTGLDEYGTYLLSRPLGTVPSAMRGLTSLFGMGRGEHPRQKHHKKGRSGAANIVILGSCRARGDKIKAYGQLVLLDFSVATFTSVAYRRHRL